MENLLKAIYHDDLFLDRVFCSLETPETPEEEGVAQKLRTLEPEAEKSLIEKIEELTNVQAEKSFYSGVRFGVQLMADLLRKD